MPEDYRLTLSMHGLIFRTPEALALAAQQVRGTLTAIVQDLEREVKIRARQRPDGRDGRFMGHLEGSIAGEVRGQGLELTGVVNSPMPYAPVVELGRRPGKFPPLGPIQLWVRRKLNVPESRVRGVAFLIARKIAAQGFPGRFMFRDAMANRRVAYEQYWEQMKQRLAERLGAE